MIPSDPSALQAIDDELQKLKLRPQQRAAILADVRQKADANRLQCHELNVTMARAVHRTRLRGNQLMGGRVMSDPRFEMLLDLFVANHDGRRVSVSDLCFSADAPQTTGLRHIEKLEAGGFVRRFRDQKDGRRWWVEPEERAITGVSAYMTELRRNH